MYTRLNYNIFLDARRLLSIRPQFKRQAENFDKILRCITHVIYLMIQTAKTKEQKEHVTNLVTRLLHVNPKTTTDDTLLHICTSITNTIKSGYFAADDPIVRR